MNKYHKIKNICPEKKSNSSIANNILMSLRFGAFSMKRVLYVSCVGRGDQSIRPTQLAITSIKGLIISVTSPYLSGLLNHWFCLVLCRPLLVILSSTIVLSFAMLSLLVKVHKTRPTELPSAFTGGGQDVPSRWGLSIRKACQWTIMGNVPRIPRSLHGQRLNCSSLNSSPVFSDGMQQSLTRLSHPSLTYVVLLNWLSSRICMNYLQLNDKQHSIQKKNCHRVGKHLLAEDNSQHIIGNEWLLEVVLNVQGEWCILHTQGEHVPLFPRSVLYFIQPALVDVARPYGCTPQRKNNVV